MFLFRQILSKNRKSKKLPISIPTAKTLSFNKSLKKTKQTIMLSVKNKEPNDAKKYSLSIFKSPVNKEDIAQKNRQGSI